MNKHVFAAALLAAVSTFAIGVAPQANAATATATASVKAPTLITMTVLTDETGGLKGSDGKFHDTMIPSNLVLHAGVPVTIRVVNYDDMMHTVTAPGLKLNLIVKPARKVNGKLVPTVSTVTFTPTTAGHFRWHCLGPCDPWTMKASFDGPDRDGFMAGTFVVM